MKLRLFGLETCEDCQLLLELLKEIEEYIPFEYIDADADDMQKLCDKHEVDKLPHLQAIDGDNVVAEHVGPCTPAYLNFFLKHLVAEKID